MTALLQTRVPDELGEQVQDAAAQEGITTAAWLRKLVMQAFDEQAAPQHELAELRERVERLERQLKEGGRAG